MPFLAAVVVGDRSMDDDDDTATCCRLLIDAFERCIVVFYCYFTPSSPSACFAFGLQLAAVSFQITAATIGISM